MEGILQKGGGPSKEGGENLSGASGGYEWGAGWGKKKKRGGGEKRMAIGRERGTAPLGEREGKKIFERKY